MPLCIKTMPRGNFFSAEEQKKIDAQVANAVKLASKAQWMVERQRQLGNIPPAYNKASPFPTSMSGMNSAGRGTRMPNSSRPGGVNIVGGTIGNAVIGSDQPVSFDQQMKVFGKGAERTRYKILGGNFQQANIGGEVTTYNNKKSTVGASDSTTGISSEDLLLEILLKGTSVTQLSQLLGKGYSLANIALSLPDNEDRRDRMIAVLLH